MAMRAFAITGLLPGPVAPFVSWLWKVARLSASFGFAQTAPPSSPSTRAICSREGAVPPADSISAISWSAFARDCCVSLADLKFSRATTANITSRIMETM